MLNKETNIQLIKVHTPLVQAIEKSLHSIFVSGFQADKEVNAVLKTNKSWGSRDRSFYAESIYDIVRWKLKYEFQLERQGIKVVPKDYKSILLVSLLSRKYALKNPEILGFTEDAALTLLNSLHLPIEDYAIETSFPKELYSYCSTALGTSWKNVAACLNQQASVYLRVNTIKTAVEKCKEALNKEAVAFKAATLEVDDLFLPHAIEILSKNNLKNSTYYKQGWFEFQDLGSQLISVFSLGDIKDFTTLRVLDMCAGAGGKTVHLSALMGNKGKIIATDFNSKRLIQLEKRALQAGCRNIQLIDFKELAKSKPFDIILIDAPCSGLGTLKRSLDIKWKLKVGEIENYISIQQQLLKDYSPLLKKNGKLIYATCSILPQENEMQIERFLAEQPQFKLEKSLTISPEQYNSDGFYMARLERI